MQARTRGSPFALLNGATAQDVLCVYVPDGVLLDKPIHVVYIPTGAPQTARARQCPERPCQSAMPISVQSILSIYPNDMSAGPEDLVLPQEVICRQVLLFCRHYKTRIQGPDWAQDRTNTWGMVQY